MRHSIVYDKPGRLRVRFGRNTFSAAQGYGIEALLLSDASVFSAEATPVNGGVLILYEPGARDGLLAMLDGLVICGEALVNESSMTGEPYGVHRIVGDSVYAGTVLEEGGIDVRVRTLAENTRIQNIISLIDDSESMKAELQSKAERLADSIVPYSFLAAAAALLQNSCQGRQVSRSFRVRRHGSF